MNIDESIARDLPANHNWLEAGNTKLRFEAGKGSRPRPVRIDRFRQNWSRINWGRRTK